MGRAILSRAALGIALAAPLAALACGACIEDKIAAAYDHAVVASAAANHRIVVFAGVEGAGDAAKQAESVKRAAARVRGVDRASIRAAASPSALSFALDPRARDPLAALSAIEKAVPGTQLTLLRVVR
jgi:hypothetical protein